MKEKYFTDVNQFIEEHKIYMNLSFKDLQIFFYHLSFYFLPIGYAID